MAAPKVRDHPPVPISEHSRVLIAMHKAMRTDSQRLIRAVDALPAGDTHQAAGLGRAFGAIVGLIHDHHWTEDDVMYPFLLERVPTFERDAIRLEDDHVELDEAAAFDRVLVDHLDREEAVVVPPFESLLSEADQHTLQRRRPSSPPTARCHPGSGLGAAVRSAHGPAVPAEIAHSNGRSQEDHA
jgi:hemerythrin-like domain-containing protein